MIAKIRLNKRTKTIRVVNKNNNVRLDKTTKTIKVVNRKNNIRLQHTGRTGPAGPEGQPGVGLPSDGTTDQILKKNSDISFDYGWVDANELADKNFIMNFTLSSNVEVNHNLNKYPAVTVIDSAGDEVVGEVYYTSPTQLTVRFINPFSGSITCN